LAPCQENLARGFLWVSPLQALAQPAIFSALTQDRVLTEDQNIVRTRPEPSAAAAGKPQGARSIYIKLID